MSALDKGRSRGLLTPGEWEQRLVQHYLRSDGPAGGTPLSYIDATPAELATAIGIAGVSEDDAQTAFLAHFNMTALSDWLSGSRLPSTLDGAEPGYFRFLVLTALVSATDTGAGETHNFRIRLGELLGQEGQFNSVSSVNSLWQSLADWSERKRASGEPIRRIELPPHGNANLIGIAVRIAFPSWKDRSALTRVLRTLPPVVRRSPERLIQELTRDRHVHDLPHSVASALRDFSEAWRARRRMLLGHRFWRLVQSIDTRLLDERRGDPRERWRLELHFEGYEQDVARLSLFRVATDPSDTPTWEGALQELEAMPRGSLPKKLAEAFDQGVLVFSEEPGMMWVLDEESPADDAYAVLLVRAGSFAAKWPLATSWRALEASWRASGRLDVLDLSALRLRLGLASVGEPRPMDLAFEGGVKTDRSTWLGLPRFLPRVSASPLSSLSAEPTAGARGGLSVAGGPPSWDLVSHDTLSGRWRVRAIESGNDTEKVICFEARAPELWEFPPLEDRFETEADMAPLGVSHLHARTSALRSPTLRPEIADILEAMYAGGTRGWPEGELIRLLRPVMPRGQFVWDFLRGLAEAAWLDPVVLKSWRARMWRLRPPHLRHVAPNGAIVGGAVGAAARERLADVVRAANGHLTYLSGVSEWSLPLPFVHGMPIEELAGELGWPILAADQPQLVSAPDCWPKERRSGGGRDLAGVWSFEAGIFLPPDGRPAADPIRLERLKRERGDDRDVYRVTGRSEAFVTSSRSTAILEAYRQAGRPLFAWRDGRFLRLARSGYLPLEMARALVARASRASGPALREDGSWTYEYPADGESVAWVARTLGAAVSVGGAAVGSDLLDIVVARRRSGTRLLWSEGPYSR